MNDRINDLDFKDEPKLIKIINKIADAIDFENLEIGNQYKIFLPNNQELSGDTFYTLLKKEDDWALFLPNPDGEIPFFYVDVDGKKCIYASSKHSYRYKLHRTHKPLQFIDFCKLEKDKKYDWHVQDKEKISLMICNPHIVVARSDDEVVFIDSKGKYTIVADEEIYKYTPHREPIITEDDIGHAYQTIDRLYEGIIAGRAVYEGSDYFVWIRNSFGEPIACLTDKYGCKPNGDRFLLNRND